MREIAHSSIQPARRPLLRLASCTCVDCTACVIQTNCKPPANAEQTLLVEEAVARICAVDRMATLPESHYHVETSLVSHTELYGVSHALRLSRVGTLH
eukprot:COSAG01_NODE_3792_length_5691_cov_11.941166_8_plen_98_part_00